MAPGHARESVLIVGPSWVGDMVMAQSLFRLLAKDRPGIGIDVLAPSWSGSLLERMPEIRQPHAMPIGHGQLRLRERYRIAAELRSFGYHQAIVLPNTFKAALIPYWAKIPLRTGFRGEQRWHLLNDLRRLERVRLPGTVERFVALGRPPARPLPDPVPHPRLRVSADAVARALDKLALAPPAPPVLGICPGAEYGPAKRWPAEYFAEVAGGMRERGWEVWLFGSSKDAPSAQRISDHMGGGCTDLSGRTTLAEAIDLMSLTTAVVSNDSGLMHVAAALDRRLVALFGSSDPGFTPPLSDRATVLSLHLPCSPCFRRECPLGHLRCLRGLRPERVLRALASEDGSASVQ
jgi:heptosyltransferase-2